MCDSLAGSGDLVEEWRACPQAWELQLRPAPVCLAHGCAYAAHEERQPNLAPFVFCGKAVQPQGAGCELELIHGLRTQCGVNFFILDSRRVLAPAPKVLGPKHISNPDFAPKVARSKNLRFDRPSLLVPQGTPGPISLPRHP